MDSTLPEYADNNNARAKLAHIDFLLEVEWAKERCGDRVFWDARREEKKQRREMHGDGEEDSRGSHGK